MADDQHHLLGNAEPFSVNSEANGDIISPSESKITDYGFHQSRANSPNYEANHTLGFDDVSKDHLGRDDVSYSSQIYSRPRTLSGNIQTVTPPPVIEGQIKIYKRRWFILFVYFLLPLNQAWVWAAWGPLAGSAKLAFNWDKSVIAMMTNWGPISFIVGIIPFTWLMDVKGLRWSVVSSFGLLAAGTAMRCISDKPPMCTVLIHIGQALNGLAGPVAMAGVTLMSAAWFPPHQRTTSTALGTMGGGIGISLSFVIAPLLVPRIHNSTSNSSDSELFLSEFHHNHTDHDVEHERKYIMQYMYIACGLSVFSFILSLIYFPKQPPLPPCKSASVKRIDYNSGLRKLMRHLQFWLIASIFGLSTGVVQCWGALLPVNLKPLNISQDTSDWMGFTGTMVGLVIGLIVSRFADIFRRNMKMFLLVLYICFLGTFLWVTLMIAQIVPHSYIAVYVGVVLTSVCLSAAYPLFFEFSCEITFPIAEGIATGTMALMSNIAALVFLGVMSIPNIGSVWASWCGVGSIAACIPILFLLREHYGRLEIDEQILTVEPPDGDWSNPAPDVPSSESSQIVPTQIS